MNHLVDDIPVISIISKIEVLGFNTHNEHAIMLQNFMDDATILDLSNAVVDMTIAIRKKYKTKLPDAIIAATALVYNLTLITRNMTDFKLIEGLRIINPHEL